MKTPQTSSRADVDASSSALFNIIEIVNSEGKSSLILGDVNICLLKYGTNDKTSDYVEGSSQVSHSDRSYLSKSDLQRHTIRTYFD